MEFPNYNPMTDCDVCRREKAEHFFGPMEPRFCDMCLVLIISIPHFASRKLWCGTAYSMA
jgi:hypothetical protein